MKLRRHNPPILARGLTIIELVVVLAILVALAGLIIGNFPTLLSKASGSTSANTIQDIGRAMSINYTVKGFYPTSYDNLEKAVLPTASAAQLNLTTTIPAAAVTALAGVGITNIVNLMAYPTVATDATWAVSDATNVVTISTTNKIAFVTDTTLINRMVPNTNGYYLPFKIYVFGLGRVCTLVGGNSTLLEAPTRMGSSGLDNSSQYYQRYCPAFLVDNNSNVRFIGAVAPTATGFYITDDATKMYQTN